MSFWDTLFGKTAADTSRSAAADQYGKQQSAIQKLLGYGDQYKANQDELSTKYDPFISTGMVANDEYQHLLADPSSVRSLPGYQFNQEEGTRAIDRSAAARGMDASGRTLKDLMRFGTGLADKTYGDQLARLMSGTQLGLGATGQQVATESAGNAGQLGARTTAYGGDIGSAGTIGQGEVAGAQAESTALGNLMNIGGFLGGKALGGGFGTSLGKWAFGK